MDLRQIRTFVHIAELHSFTRASAFLNVSQPALSRQMKLLEEDLGIKLFHRHGHGVDLTNDGAAFLERCRQVLSEFESLRKDFLTRGQGAGVTGTASLGLPVPATRFIGRAFLADLYREHSGVSLRVVEGFSALLHEWLLSGSLDLAILYGPRPSKILTTEPLLIEDLHAIVAVNDINRYRPWISAEELAEMPLILPNRPHVLRSLVDQLNLRKVKIIEVGAISMMIELARAGQGVTILPRSAVDSALLSGDLIALPIHEPNLSWDVSVCYSNVRPLSGAAEIVLRLLRKEIRTKVHQGTWKARLISAQNRTVPRET